MAVKITKINKGVGKLLRNPKNLALLTDNKLAGVGLTIENDVCCGLGRKTIYFAKNAAGVPVKIRKYPVTFNGVKYQDRTELEQALTEFFGVGYIVYIPNAGNAIVLSAAYKKGANAELEEIPDFVVIS